MSTSRILRSSRLLFYSCSTLRTFHCSPITRNILYRSFVRTKQRIGGLLPFVNTSNNPLIAAMSSAEPNIKIVTFEDVKKLKNTNDTLLIDVRELSELQETGVLPGSINIPLGQVENVLKNTSAEEFIGRYGRPKPDANFPLVFSCRSGRRSEMAAHTAIKLGFKNVSSYSGGWLDWEEKTKQ